MGRDVLPDRFSDLMWFLAVVEERSFTRAAARLGLSQSTLSHGIKALEERMGLRLLNRTTRSVAMTEAGERLYQTVAPRMTEISAEIDALMALRDRPAGRVRITLSDHAMSWIVAPRLIPLLRDHPDIEVELLVDNGFRDIVGEGLDAGIRLGEHVEADMIAVRVSPDWRPVAVASPAYLEVQGAPRHPKDLLHHRCINHRQLTSGGTYAWEFAKGEEAVRIRVNGPLTTTNALPMIEAARAGLAIAFLPEDIVQADIARGELVLLLDDWTPRFQGYFLYFPSRQQNLPAFRAVVDALRHKEGSSLPGAVPVKAASIMA